MNFLRDFFNRVSYSITNVNKYPEMALEGAGKAFKYLLIFTLIFGMIGGLGFTFNIKSGLDQIIYLTITELPEFRITNGELDVEGEMPIVYGDNEFVVIIDDTGNTTTDVLDDYYGGFLFLKDGVAQKTTFQITEYKYEDFGLAHYEKQDLINLIAKIEGVSIIGLIILLVFYLIIFYIGKMIGSLLLTIIGLVLAAIQKSEVPFAKLYAMSIYALTLPILLAITLSFFDFNLKWYFYYGIASVYLWFAIKSWKEKKEEPEEDIIEEV